MDINVNPALLSSVGSKVTEQYKVVMDNLQVIEDTVNGLSSWQSTSKEQYVSKLKEDMTKMYEIAEAIKSYGAVATGVANKVNQIEERIKASLGA